MARSLFARHADGFQRSGGGVASGAAPHAAQPSRSVDEILAGHPFVERILLGAQPDEAIQRRIVPNALAQHADFALRGKKLPGGQLQQRRFSRAVRAEQPGDAGRHLDRQLVQPDHVAVPFRHFVELTTIGVHLRRSSDRTRKCRIHAEITK